MFTTVRFLFLFFPVAFLIYWSCRKGGAGLQNAVLVLASFLFYALWDVGACGLLLAVAVVSYLSGLGIDRMRFAGSPRSALTIKVMAVTLLAAVLAVFKYADFFLVEACALLGQAAPASLNLLLPVGLSFYVFMAISYVLDVASGKIASERNPLTFLSYMTFFPQLASGPIGRGDAMLPQFRHVRAFDYGLAVDGCRQFLWGAFKKMAVADVCSVGVNAVWQSYGQYTGATLVYIMLVYSVQIYADFSGYSDMAIGIGKLFGIRLASNFSYPYFAANIADFWRRWHMSLTTWFRDYIYIPLGGSRCSRMRHIFNTLVVFLVSGLWHGANWTFVLWGFVHGLFFIPYIVTRGGKRILVWMPNGIGWLLTMIGVAVAWVFFRAPSVGVAFDYLQSIKMSSLLSIPQAGVAALPWMLIMLVVEWLNRKHEHGLEISRLPVYVRCIAYMAIGIACVASYKETTEFIYFQF